MAKQIHSITYNWYSGPNGEEYAEYIVGFREVVYIGEVLNYGDRPFYIVHFQDGTELTIYNANTVTSKPKENNEPIQDFPF